MRSLFAACCFLLTVNLIAIAEGKTMSADAARFWGYMKNIRDCVMRKTNNNPLQSAFTVEPRGLAEMLDAYADNDGVIRGLADKVAKLIGDPDRCVAQENCNSERCTGEYGSIYGRLLIMQAGHPDPPPYDPAEHPGHEPTPEEEDPLHEYDYVPPVIYKPCGDKAKGVLEKLFAFRKCWTNDYQGGDVFSDGIFSEYNAREFTRMMEKEDDDQQDNFVNQAALLPDGKCYERHKCHTEYCEGTYFQVLMMLPATDDDGSVSPTCPQSGMKKT